MSLPSFYETKPYKFQEEIVDKSKDEKFYGLFLEQGTGKSKVAIDTFNYLSGHPYPIIKFESFDY